jgi:hypothetical protein
MTNAWEKMAQEALGEEEPKRYLKVIRASDIGMEATCWTWEDDAGKWLPQGEVSLIAGREGVGKSTVTADLVAKLTRGLLPGEHFGTPKHVIICATEDSWRQTINPRLSAAGADLSKVIRVEAYTPEGLEGVLQLPEDIEEIRRIAAEHDVVLIVLDPLMSTLSSKLNPHVDAEVRRGLEPLSRLAHTSDLAVIGLIHENKSNATDLLSRIMGSRAFAAVVRAVLYCANRELDEDDTKPDEFGQRPPRQFVFGQAKSNLGKQVPFAIRYTIDGTEVGWDDKKGRAIWSSRIVWGATEDQSIQDIIREQESQRTTKKSEAKTWLKEYLDGKGEIPVDTLMKAAEAEGHTRSTSNGHVGCYVLPYVLLVSPLPGPY